MGEGLAALKARLEALTEGAKRTLAAPVTAETAGAVRDLQADAVKLGKDIEAQRRSEKKPHEDAAKAVDGEFRPVGEAVDKIAAAVKAALTAWMLAEEKRRRDEELAARKAAEDARKAAEEAAKADDPFEAFDAGHDKAKAEAQAAEAAKLAQSRVRVGAVESGAKAASLRTYWDVTVADGPALVSHFAESPTLIEEARKLAAAQVRAAKGAACGIPGITINERKESI